MPLVDVEMTDQEEEAILGVAPSGKYRLKLVAVRMDEGSGTNWFTSEKTGNRYMKVAFQINDEDPQKAVHKGKFPKDYNAVKGTGFMAMLRRAFPMACSGTMFDTDVAIGQHCIGKLKVNEYEGVTKNEIQALMPLKE